MTNIDKQEFFKRPFLEKHIKKTLAFYQPNVFAESGGFYQHFMDDGRVYDENTRHLVSSTRFVFNYAMAAKYEQDAKYLPWVSHGIDYLLNVHYQPDTGGFAWLLNDEKGKVDVVDATNHCYGLAFAMVAGATAFIAGEARGKELLEKAWQVMEAHFWQVDYACYADEANGDFSQLSDYRGQNANMHACEAMIWAYRATSEDKYLQRATQLAQSICQRQASLSNGFIWEHYHPDWSIDWDYNRDDPKHLFRPWGFQPGHQIEWAKLLCQLNRLVPNQTENEWLLERAQWLFKNAIEISWDEQNGGVFYGFAPDHSICDDEKYFWVQAESFAATYQLFNLTNDSFYADWYEKIWDFSWAHMIDHRYGAWYRILSATNQKLEDTKSPAGKTDYHTMGACYEVLSLLP